ncbi:MAG: PAS domain S-box protein [Dehalococcoidales bacterium]|nr:PAS domain S-box protein [Dehalococcoidales bacterium]
MNKKARSRLKRAISQPEPIRKQSPATPASSEADSRRPPGGSGVSGRSKSSQRGKPEQVRLPPHKPRGKYREFFDSVPIGYLIVDRESIIVEANLAAAEMLGIDRNSLVNSSFICYIDPDSRDACHTGIHKAFGSPERQSFDLRIRKKNGDSFFARLDCLAALDPASNQDICRIVISDVNEYKQIEHDLKEHEAFNNNIMMEAPNPLILYDFDCGVCYVNPAFEAITGYSSVEIIGLHPPFPWWPEECAGEYMLKAIPEIDTPGFIPEERFRKKSGEEFWVYISTRVIEMPGKVKRLISSWIDITRHKLSEENLRTSEETFSRAFNAVPIPMSIATLKEGRFIDVNNSFLKTLGLNRDQVIGRRVTEFDLWGSVHDRERIVQAVQKYGRIEDVELPIKNSSGEIGIISVSAVRLMLDRTECLLVAAHDITDHKKTEKALSRSRNSLEEQVRLRTVELHTASAQSALRAMILDMASDAVIMYSQDGKLIYANEAVSRLYGYTRDDLANFNVSRLIPPDEMPGFHDRIAAVISRGDIRSDVDHLRKDGTKVSVEMHSRLIETEGRRYIINIVRDNTERHQAEEKLKYQAMLLENISDAVISTDMDEKIISWNKAAEQMYGWKEEEVLGRDAGDIIGTEFPPGERDEYLKSLLEHGSWRGEYIHRRKDGSPILVSGSTTLARRSPGKPDRIISINRDISNRKKVSDEIKQNELRLKSIMDAMTEGIALIAPDGTVILTNKAEAGMLGLESPEVRIGLHFRNEKLGHIYPDGTPLSVEESAVVSAIKRKRSIRDFEEGLIREDGSILWINSNAVPVINDSGEVIGVVRTMIDITERKRLMDERDQFTRRLLDVQEEERKRISRELHDDTAQYLALLTLEMDSLIEKGKQLPAETIEHLHKLRNTVTKTLKEVRRFSHELRPSVLEHFGLAAALELIINEFNTSYRTVVSFTCEGSEERLPDEIELALFRIAQEALSNIRKHSEASKAEVVLSCRATKVRLTISDNGKGFKIVRQNQAESKGSLGLIGMRERAHIIGANLKVRSRINKGTVISVGLTLKNRER